MTSMHPLLPFDGSGEISSFVEPVLMVLVLAPSRRFLVPSHVCMYVCPQDAHPAGPQEVRHRPVRVRPVLDHKLRRLRGGPEWWGPREGPGQHQEQPRGPRPGDVDHGLEGLARR